MQRLTPYALAGLLLLPPAVTAQVDVLSPNRNARGDVVDPTPPPAHAELYNDLRVPLSPYFGASAEFLKLHKVFAESLEQNDAAAAGAMLARMQNLRMLNDYEQSFVHLGAYQLAALEEDPTGQMLHLHNMLATIDQATDVVLLPEGLMRMALRELFKLQVNLNYLGEAAQTYARISDTGDMEAVLAFRPGMDQITALATNAVSYPVRAMLDADGTWSLALHKRQFFIDQVQFGAVKEVIVDCAGNMQSIAVEPEFGYDVPAALGACTLRFSGDPETSFVVTQYRD